MKTFVLNHLRKVPDQLFQVQLTTGQFVYGPAVVNATDDGALVLNSEGGSTVVPWPNIVSLQFVGPESLPTLPDITSSGVISGTRGDGLTIAGTAATATGTPAPTLTYQWQAFDGVWADIVGATGASYVDTALTEPLNLRRRVTAQNTSGSDVDFSNTLTGNAAVAPTISNAGTISGTRGDGLTITGSAPAASGNPAPTFSYQWQSFSTGSWSDISGATSANYTDTTATEGLLIRRQVTATNSAGSDTDVSNALSGLAGGGIPEDKLVLLSNRTWLDTAAAGDALATMVDYQTGATYTAKLIAPANWPTPPADALTVVGGEVRAGAGYATGVHPGKYKIEVENTSTGFTTHSYITVLSDKATAYTAANPTELNNHLATIGALITSDPAAFPGAVIDIAPGDYGEVTFTQIPRSTQSKQVILRSSSADRANGAKPRFKRVSIDRTKLVLFQSLKFEPYGIAYGENFNTGGPLINLIGGTGNSLDEFGFLNCEANGGDIEWNGSGQSRVNPSLTPDPTNIWHPTHSFFAGVFTTQTFTRIDLVVGHTLTKQSGEALGVWAQATTPAYVGPNTPDGTARVFTKESFVPNVYTSSGADVPVPPNFDAEFEVAYLTSTPVATTHGGLQSKPDGGPDGNYIVAWRLVNGGSPWTNAVTSIISENSLGWVNQASYWDFPVFIEQPTTNAYRNLVIADCKMRSLKDAIRIKIMETTECAWSVDNEFDCITRDAQQIFWNTATASDFRIWSPPYGFFTAFNKMGRSLVRESSWRNPHGDFEQHAADWNSDFSQIQTHIERIGNLLSVRDGFPGAGFQGPFCSDMFRGSSGYRVVSGGNFIDCAESNAWSAGNNSIEYASHDTVISRFGSSNEGYPTDPAWPAAVSRQKCTYGTRGPLSALLNEAGQPRVYLDDRSSSGNGVDIWSNPVFSYSIDYAVQRSRFTAIGANAGYGCFANRDTIIDQEHRAWNPNQWEFRLFLPPLLDQPLDTLVSSVPRQLLFGSKPMAVSVSGGVWSKGATREAALAATPTASSGTLAPGEWIVLWVQTSVYNTDGATVTATINGVVSTFSTRTEPGSSLAPPEPGLEPTIVGSPAVTALTAGGTVFNAVTTVSVPDGGMIVAYVAIDGIATTTEGVFISGADADWEDVLQYNRSGDFGFRIYRYRNRTGAPVDKSLTLTSPVSEQWACISFVYARATVGYGVEGAFQLGVNASGTSIDPPYLQLDANRRHIGTAVVFTANANSATAGTAPYTNLVNRTGTASSNSVSIGIAYATGLTNNHTDPGVVTMNASWATISVTAAVWEAPL